MEIGRWQTWHSNAGNTLGWLALLLYMHLKKEKIRFLNFRIPLEFRRSIKDIVLTNE